MPAAAAAAVSASAAIVRHQSPWQPRMRIAVIPHLPPRKSSTTAVDTDAAMAFNRWTPRYTVPPPLSNYNQLSQLIRTLNPAYVGRFFRRIRVP